MAEIRPRAAWRCNPPRRGRGGPVPVWSIREAFVVTPKQRVHAALRREPVDRVPVFLWFHPETARRLGELLEIPASEVGAAMGDDVRMTWVNNNWAMEGVVHERDGESHTDFWGITWRKEGAFNQPSRFPLAGASREDVLAYRFPGERIGFLLGLMAPVLAQADRFFVGCDVSRAHGRCTGACAVSRMR
jgi:hypothetical protein